VRRIIYSVIADLLDRFADFRYRRWRQGRSWIHGEAIAFYLLVVGTLLALGILAARAATRSSSVDVGLSYAPGSVTREVVTQTITRKGKTVRVIRHRTKAGGLVFETVSSRGITLVGPARTIRETRTRTVTTRDISTVTVTQPVTVIQPVTVTVFETVTVQPAPP
jgi:hypothetical protein